MNKYLTAGLVVIIVLLILIIVKHNKENYQPEWKKPINLCPRGKSNAVPFGGSVNKCFEVPISGLMNETNRCYWYDRSQVTSVHDPGQKFQLMCGSCSGNLDSSGACNEGCNNKCLNQV